MNSNATTPAAVSEPRGPATTKMIVETLQMKTAVSIIGPLLALLAERDEDYSYTRRGVVCLSVSVCLPLCQAYL